MWVIQSKEILLSNYLNGIFVLFFFVLFFFKAQGTKI